MYWLRLKRPKVTKANLFTSLKNTERCRELWRRVDKKSVLVSVSRENSAEREVVIRNVEGLHMRPAMQFVDCANGFDSRITVEKGTQSVDGKSIMQVTMLAATSGTKLKIIAEGQDAERAVEELSRLLEDIGAGEASPAESGQGLGPESQAE